MFWHHPPTSIMFSVTGWWKALQMVSQSIHKVSQITVIRMFSIQNGTNSYLAAWQMNWIWQFMEVKGNILNSWWNNVYFRLLLSSPNTLPSFSGIFSDWSAVTEHLSSADEYSGSIGLQHFYLTWIYFSPVCRSAARVAFRYPEIKGSYS